MGELYAGPGAHGDGTPDDPMALSEALAIGGMIHLLPGRYVGDWRIMTPNTTLKSAPGARAILDGDVQLWGAEVVLHSLEITYTEWTTRTTAQAGGTPTDIPWQKGLSIYGRNTRVLNCYIHDMPNGVGWWKTAIDSEIAGCLIANNGWQGADRGHGPGIYAQNEMGVKVCHDNIILPSYSFTGFQFYGSENAALIGFQIERNVVVQTRFLVGSSSTPSDNIHAIGNLLWKTSIELGYKNPLNGSAEIRGNYIGQGAISPHTLQTLEMTGNTVINAAGLAVMDLQAPNAGHAYQIDGNQYRSDQPIVFWNGSVVSAFPGWQAAGYDIGGSFTALPTEPAIFVRNNVVTIFNWSNQLSIAAPIAGRYRNCQNPVESVVLAQGDPLPMTIWTVATPYAADAPLTAWDSRFGCFLVEDV